MLERKSGRHSADKPFLLQPARASGVFKRKGAEEEAAVDAVETETPAAEAVVEAVDEEPDNTEDKPKS